METRTQAILNKLHETLEKAVNGGNDERIQEAMCQLDSYLCIVARAQDKAIILA